MKIARMLNCGQETNTLAKICGIHNHSSNTDEFVMSGWLAQFDILTEL